MFICLLQSIKVTLNEEELSCYEIFRVMLKNDNLHFLSNPYEEPVRQLSEMPDELQQLSVTNAANMSSLGFYLPIKKWSCFDVYEKETIEEQMYANVIERLTSRLFINPSNFLIRIPKFFQWNSPPAEQLDGNGQLVTLQGDQNNNAFAERLLK